jgi:hypothetical protein
MDRQKGIEKSVQAIELRSVTRWALAFLSAVPALLATLQLVGCASYSDLIGEIRSDFIAGDYQTALEQIDQSKIKSDNSSQLLYHLERAMILDRIGNLDASRKELLKADRLADDLYTVSVSKTAASYIVSDDVGDYAGEDYERVAIQTMLALSFIADGDLPNAQVAARRINSKLAQIIDTYGTGAKASYNDDAFARYLAGMIHEARNDFDNAIVEYGNSISTYKNAYQEFSNGKIPDGLQQAYYRLLVARRRSDKIPAFVKSNPTLAAAVDAQIEKENKNGVAQIVVIHESGQISPKISLSSFTQIGSQLVRLSFPAIRHQRERLYGATGIELAEGKFISASIGSDLDAIGAQSLEDRKARIIAKGLTRAMIKGQVVEQTRQNFGEGAGLLMNIITAATETADTRSWSLLPKRLFVTRAWVRPGTHRMNIKTQGRETPVEITLRPGELKLIRASDAAPVRSLPTAGL